jgi:hypothetical protein
MTTHLRKTAAAALTSGVILCAPLFASQNPAAPPVARQRILMDADWQFQQLAPVALDNSVSVTTWRWRSLQSRPTDTDAAALNPSGTEWKDVGLGADVFGGRSGFAWFSTTLPALPRTGRVLQFAAVDDNATVYLNGVKVFQHEGWNDPFEVPLDSAWNASGPNNLVVLVQNTAGAGGITGKRHAGKPQRLADA